MMRESISQAVAGSSFEKRQASIMYLGQSVHGEEIWQTADQVKTHTFVSGSTGSGKTELLTGMIANAIGWGSGAVIIDGKGDVNFFAKVHLIAKSLGREEDILLLDFRSANTVGEKGFWTHTANPFAGMSVDEMCQVLTTMLPRPGGDGAMWQERSVGMMTALITALHWECKLEGMELTPEIIERSLSLQAFIDLSKRLIDKGAPVRVQTALDSYLQSIPGFKTPRQIAEATTGKKGENPAKQEQTAYDQHGYLIMQWSRILSLLNTQFGHIFNQQNPDVDVRDVILNRRILIVLLPSLERSTSDIANLGSLVVGMIKQMMGQALRTPVEGGWVEVVEDRMTNARYPFMIFMDEAGSYLSDGMGLMAQQARSLNIGLVYATQDFESLMAANPRETEAILANTNTKIFLKAENPNGMQISRAVDTVSRKRISQENYLAGMDQARHRQLIDRAHYGGNRHEIARELEALNEINVKAMQERAEPEISVLLRGFKTGQMICIHGDDCVQGRSNFVEITDIDKPHVIALERFAPTNDRVRAALKVFEMRETIARISDRALKAAGHVVTSAIPEQMIKPEQWYGKVAGKIIENLDRMKSVPSYEPMRARGKVTTVNLFDLDNGN